MLVERRFLRIRRRAAPAPQPPEPVAEKEARTSLPPHIDELAAQWGWWCSTRRFYGPPVNLGSPIASMRDRTPTRTDGGGGPNARCSQELAVFHIAVLSQPVDQSRLVFELHYRWHRHNIKAAAAKLQISRQHWYRLRNTFARRAWAEFEQLLAEYGVTDTATK